MKKKTTNVITADNVKCIGEILALQALKTTIAYTGKENY